LCLLAICFFSLSFPSASVSALSPQSGLGVRPPLKDGGVCLCWLPPAASSTLGGSRCGRHWKYGSSSRRKNYRLLVKGCFSYFVVVQWLMLQGRPCRSPAMTTFGLWKQIATAHLLHHRKLQEPNSDDQIETKQKTTSYRAGVCFNGR
jgi:hypothetical protein